jgi:ribonuclease BN (tRNA processing enzyme)
MKLRILGCSGGIGANLRTTSFLLDHDVLIDAGTGVGDLSFEELCAIDHVFVTHSHLDHIASIPLLVDTAGSFRQRPVVVHAMEQTLDVLREHIFNWEVWPDFSVLPDPRGPFMRYEPIFLGQAVELDGRRITPVPALHTVPAVGFHLDSGRAGLVYSGDTVCNDAFWQYVNSVENLRYLIIETAFSDQETMVAKAARHLCPGGLAQELAKLKRPVEIYITHLKPGEVNQIMEEIEHRCAAFHPIMLQQHKIFEF